MFDSTRTAPRPLLVSIATLAALAAVGCAAPIEEALKLSAKRAFVAPVDFNVATPTQFEPGLEVTDQLVQMFLKHRGLKVERVPLGRFTKLWRAATEGKRLATDSPEVAIAAGKILAELAPGDEHSVLVLPGLSSRIGELAGTKARWDGTAQKVIYEGLRDDHSGHLSGPTNAASIWIRVFSSSGRLVHEGYGGTELTWKYGGRSSGNRWYYAVVERDDLFRDQAIVANGIKLAFDPYIPK